MTKDFAQSYGADNPYYGDTGYTGMRPYRVQPTPTMTPVQKKEDKRIGWMLLTGVLGLVSTVLTFVSLMPERRECDRFDICELTAGSMDWTVTGVLALISVVLVTITVAIFRSLGPAPQTAK